MDDVVIGKLRFGFVLFFLEDCWKISLVFLCFWYVLYDFLIILDIILDNMLFLFNGFGVNVVEIVFL